MEFIGTGDLRLEIKMYVEQANVNGNQKIDEEWKLIKRLRLSDKMSDESLTH